MTAELDYWLREWARWMRQTIEEGGYPPTASGFGNCVSNFAVSENDAGDYWETRVQPAIIQAIDAAIDSLQEAHRRAIWQHYGLCRSETNHGPSVTFLEAFAAVRVLVLARVAIAGQHEYPLH